MAKFDNFPWICPLASGLLILDPSRFTVMVVNSMRFNPVSTLDRERDQDIFESVTEEEIIYLWRSIKGKGLSEDEAWQAIVTGIALDMAFAKTKTTKEIEQ
ncbi:MAG TPA: hypothetical protein VLD83_03045 [Candidatus Binatia bacterium]|nr:hypothetical protein [Candidatus Binatia bacterium]